MKAIDTVYKGYKFRSRLEARWAVFLDALDLKWEYEKEGYVLPSGYYLPDFWISTVNMWAEVKPGDFSQTEYKLAMELVGATKFPILLLDGTPENRPYFGITEPWGAGYEFCLSACYHHDYPHTEHRFFAEPSIDERAWPDTEIAVIAARSARFEHGERP